MRYLSVCSGIEAATVAWHPLGWKPVAYSEIEPFPSAVLAHHYPDVPNVGDMTKYKEWDLGAIDVLVGGTPCQSFSVAGLRKGLADPRGNLALVYCGILDHFRPKWFVWENVPGVLSSGGGRDFGSFLGAVAELGYGFAYRVLDAQYLGVAQRRRRVFVVGHLGDWRPAAAVLFERESLRGDPAPSRKAWQRVAPTVASGAPFSRTGNERVETEALVSMCLNAGAMGRLDAESKTLLPVAATIDATDGRKWGSNQWVNQGKAIIQPVAFHPTQDPISSANVCHSIGANSNATVAVMQPAIAWDEELNASVEQAGTLLRGGDGGRHDGVAVAFSRNDDGRDATNDLAPTMRVAGRAGGMLGIATAMQVRRLTPMECERLQGFPDNYTAIPWRKKPTEDCPDGPRYKALGNSMAVPVMAWIGKRIADAP